MNPYLMGLIVLLLIVCGVLGYFVARKPQPISTVTNTYSTTLPVQTHIIYKDVPGQIDNSSGHEVATLDTTFVSPDRKTTAAFAIRYDEQSNLFNLGANISTVRDSIYVEKVITHTLKPPFIGLTGGVSVGFQDKAVLRNAQIDAGIKVRGKYSATVFYNTDKFYGLRFGIDF